MKLSKLFDYQKFENNKNLESVINDVEHKYYNSSVRELTVDEIDYVAAAGSKANINKAIEEKDD